MDRLKAGLADRYAIEGELGSGGMAIVYLAMDLKHHRKVAVKVLRPELARAVGSERFLREIEISAGLRHPHILPLYDSGDADGFLFYVMPLVEGESLRERLDREKQLPVDDALQIAREVADALSYAHSHGVIHRDIKPANILVESGHAVVADFGIARAVSAAGEQRLTQTGLTVGTPAYMSPEQAAGDEKVDGRSDLYSLACVLYEMLAGQAPFTGPTIESVLYQHLTVDPPPITNLRPTVPAGLVGVLDRGLAKNRADRFSPAAQFAEALKLATVPAAVQVSGAGLEAARAAALADPTLDRPRRIESIAVLPFADLSPERDQEYFVDGMTDALISKLARVSGLRVISRTSVMRFRRTERPLPEIANELRVQALVEGSVLRVGNRVRIVAQLIDGATDDHLWAESYEGDLSDVLALQSDVAVAAAREIKTTLSPNDEANLSVHRQVDPEAYTLYLKGRHAWNRRTREGFDVAEECFKAAIERDPSSALAYSGLADTHVVRMFYQYVYAREALPKAKAAAEKAIELDDRLAGAHASLAWALLWEWDFQGSERSFQRALELNPNHANARHWYANLLVFSGRKEEAVAEMRRAVNLDPLSAPISNSLGWVLYVTGEYDAAIEQLRLTLTLEPSFSNSHLLLSLTWLEKGEAERALQSVERALELDPENLELPTFHAYVLARAGQKEQAISTLEAARRRREMPARIAIVHAALGDRDAAFEWLERAYQEHRETLLNIKLYPWFDPLRSDTRFQVLLERLGFR